MAPTNLVEIVREQAITSSLKVAEVFDKPHADVLKSIDRIISDCAQMASEQETPKLGTPETAEMFRKSTYEVVGQLRKYPFYYMNFDGFTLLAMGFTGKKALQFKLKYIAAFNAMKKIIEQRQNAEWLSIRGEVKATFRKLIDAVRDYVIPLARSQGSTASDDIFYRNYSLALCRIACFNPRSCDNLSLTQLGALNQMQDIAAGTMRVLAKRGGLTYKQVYQAVKSKLTDYARIALIAERFGEFQTAVMLHA